MNAEMAAENSAFVRGLLRDRQPGFAATLEQAERLVGAGLTAGQQDQAQEEARWALVAGSTPGVEVEAG